MQGSYKNKEAMKFCHAKVGGGGFFCQCCASPDRKDRKKFLRRLRRLYTKHLMKVLAEE